MGVTSTRPALTTTPVVGGQRVMAKSISSEGRSRCKDKVIARLKAEWAPTEQGKHRCQCGCNRIIVIRWHHYYEGIPQYLPGHRHPSKRRKDPVQRFWTKVHKGKGDDCWIWVGVSWNRGYGRFYLRDNHAVAAHRFSYELHNGPVPPGLVVLHKCDNPECVRPDHLTVGTQADNVRDRDQKGRTARGHGKSKTFVQEQIVSMRNRFWGVDGLRVRGSVLAREYGVSTTAVYAICYGRAWKHIPLPKEAGVRP